MASIFSFRLIRFLLNPLDSRFGFQALSLGFLLFFVMSFRPPQLFMYGERFGEEVVTGVREEYQIVESGFLHNNVGVNTAGLREVLVEDDEGNLVRKLQRRDRDESILYVVRSGDTISRVAHKFGLKVSTLLWANNLTVKEALHVGKKLKVPPVDGVFYKIQAGDTLGEVAKAHGVDNTQVMAFNEGTNIRSLKIGQELFLPGAIKKFIPQKPTLAGRGSYLGAIGYRLRRPTRGVLTQGFHRGHYAIDIANKLNSPIYAAADGLVTKAEHGWNYGFGKYIVVDHGNGVETLYAHNNVLKTEVGDRVKAGELIALMGNTGNVWGPTGIHLHFELHIRGRKVNPGNYF